MTDDRLRTELHREMERVRVSPRMRSRIDERHRRPLWRNPAFALSAAAIVAIAGVVVWIVGGSRDVRQEVIATPPQTQVAPPETAFRCFIEARHDRDFAAARRCMTERYASSISDPLEIIGPSSPSVERATIVSSSETDGRVVFDALVYWGSSTGLVSVSEDTIDVVRDGDRWLVDDWEPGEQQPIGETTAVSLHFFLAGSTNDCSSDDIGLLPIERLVPNEPVVDDLALSVVRELFTGPWSHERGVASAFPAGARVLSVRVADGIAHVEVNEAADNGCGEEVIRPSLDSLGIEGVRINRAPSGSPPEPDV